MASSGKRKTTGAKLAREGKLRERRAAKAARKDARKRSPGEFSDVDASGVRYGPPNPDGPPDPGLLADVPDAATAVAADA
jgi:hypothetical protein